ncbi:MAG TPA: LysM peptidoglycan-binding domain-containing protein [Longimicrobiales bacterium]|jgi:hypothetical protein
MVRSTLALAGLAILTTFAAAPSAASTVVAEPEPYTVVDGDTLWNLAERFFGDPEEWTRIYEANRERISDPRVLPPGLVLDIPRASGALVDVTVVTAGGETTTMSALPRAVPNPPQERVGPKPLDRRTVFWPDTTGDQSIAARAENLGPPMAEDVFFAAPWLLEPGEGLGGLGELSSFAGAVEIRAIRASARPQDRIRLSLDNGAPIVGAQLRAYRVTRSVPGLGDVVVPTGVLTVLEVDAAGALASVDRIFDRMRLGDRVEALPAFPFRDGELAQPLSGGPEATIVGFEANHELQSPGDIAFLDIGAEQGVELGDIFEVMWEGMPSDRAEGTLQVVGLRPGRSAARIRSLENPVFGLGVRVRLVRRLQ